VGCGKSANGYKFSLGDNRNILKWVWVMVIQLCKSKPLN
jgi:hypothetical protein